MEPKRTTVRAFSREHSAQMFRPGYVAASDYGRDLQREENEMGGIFMRGDTPFDPDIHSSAWERSGFNCVERIFTVMPNVGKTIKFRHYWPEPVKLREDYWPVTITND